MEHDRILRREITARGQLPTCLIFGILSNGHLVPKPVSSFPVGLSLFSLLLIIPPFPHHARTKFVILKQFYFVDII